MIGRSDERGSGISVLAARHDDDDDDDICVCVCVCVCVVTLGVKNQFVIETGALRGSKIFILKSAKYKENISFLL